MCQGNYKGRWMSEGGYGWIAERLFSGADVDAFFLEYDSPRAGGFEPLRHVPAGKLAVLGGVREFPVRVKCASLAWHTLKAALSGSAEVARTE